MKATLEIERVGVVRSCFGEKFGTPRQPGLCPSAWGELVYDEAFRREEMVRGLDGFSHLWLVFGMLAGMICWYEGLLGRPGQSRATARGF